MAAQISMASGDLIDGNYYNSAGNQTNLWQYITASGNDSTYITTEDQMGGAQSCTVRLSGVTDPESAVGHRIEFSIKEDSFSSAVNFTAKLLDSDGTLRSTSPAFNYSDDEGTGDFEKVGWTLSTANANAISSAGYAAGLRLEFITDDQMGMGTNSFIGWASLQLPEAPSPDPPAATQNGSAFMLFLDT
jgi:hypothetical protein